MPAAAAKADVVMGCSIRRHSQIANIHARGDIRKRQNALPSHVSHTAIMAQDDDKNGGPSHLKAWRMRSGLNGAQFAAKADITPGMLSDFENGKRKLDAKWLRHFAPLLGITPGMLLDYDPTDLDTDVISIWSQSDIREKRQIAEVVKAIVLNGNGG